jgi:hypothetical protein
MFTQSTRGGALWQRYFYCRAALYPQSCAPGPGFVDTPHPAIGRSDEFVSHTEEITIERPLAVVLSAVDKPIKDTFKKTDSRQLFPGTTC